MNVDPDKFTHLRKRSSLKQHHLFPEGMSYEEFIQHKNKKLQWDSKVESVEVVTDSEVAMSEGVSNHLYNNNLKKVVHVNKNESHVKNVSLYNLS